MRARHKTEDNLNVQTPNSVSSVIVPEKNVVLLTMDRDAKVYFSVGEKNTAEKKLIIDAISTAKGLNLTEPEKKNFYNNPTACIGVPFERLGPLLDLSPDQVKSYKSPGIPAQDSTNNQLIDWIHAAVTAFEGKPMTIMVRGDDAAAYPSFQAVLIALKKNDQLKFKLVTNPVGAPAGSELAKRQRLTGNKSSEE